MKLTLFLSFFLLYSLKSLPQKPLDNKTKTEIVNSVSKILLNDYVYPDTAILMSKHILKQLADGKYKAVSSVVALTDAMNADIKTVVNDGHFQITYNPVMEKQLLSHGELPPTPIASGNYRNANAGIRSIKILNGNIGLLELGNFVEPTKDAKEAMRSALTFLANTNAVIIDVRSNGGGSPAMVQYICGYFFEKETHLMDWYSRPANRTTQFYTTPDSTEKRFINKPLYILAGKGTASAAEEFCYDLKHLKRATLIGQATAGAAHGTMERTAGYGVIVYVPYAHSINAVTKTDWEHTGAIPDINISSEKALEVAQEKIFETLLKTTTDTLNLFELTWQYDLLKAYNNPVTIDTETLQKFCGVYGERTFTIENGELYYQRVGKPKFKLSAMTNNIMKGNDYFKIEFIKSADGSYDEIVAYYQDRRIERAVRTK
ncbi:MAG: S41 family peptidase [Bacteroidota bacterium]